MINVATSSGVVSRPVAKPPMPAMIVLRAVSASTPVALATVSATPCSLRRRSVATGPGETALTRMPHGAEFLGQRLAEADQCGPGGAVVDRGGVALEEGVHGRDLDDCSGALLDHRGQG